MKTAINDFWTTFSYIQQDLIQAASMGDHLNLHNLYCRLGSKVIAVHPKLTILVLMKPKNFKKVKLIFLPKDNISLRSISNKILAEAPTFPSWKFQVGIKPYKHSLAALCEKYGFLGPDNNIHQIYFAVHKIYKTTNKFHLILYLEMDNQCAKSEQHDIMYPILLCYLGDEFYQKHISRYKIIRRKISRLRFLPLENLRHLILFQNLN